MNLVVLLVKTSEDCFGILAHGNSEHASMRAFESFKDAQEYVPYCSWEQTDYKYKAFEVRDTEDLGNTFFSGDKDEVISLNNPVGGFYGGAVFAVCNQEKARLKWDENTQRGIEL